MSETKDLLYTLPLNRFKSYLELEDWNLVNENDRWIVFEDDDAIELAIPKNPMASDYHVYIDHVLKTLSFVQDKEPAAVADDILSYDLDIFGATLDDSADATSISMRSADAYFAELKQLLVYSASSEEKREPFFRRALQNARKVLDHFQFGHTVRGSFGYKIESKIKAANHVQYDMFADSPEPIIPHERKVMERIYKGLAATDKAVNMGDISILTEGYITGFNANMCTALLNMSGDRRDPIEYSFKWSKKIDVPEEMSTTPKIVVKRDHLEYLDEASEYLYRQDPMCVTLQGNVTNVGAKDDPRRADLEGRTIILRSNTLEGRSQRVHIVLDREEYLEASKAHIDWKTVEVRGYLEYKNSKWRLTNPEGFKILR